VDGQRSLAQTLPLGDGHDTSALDSTILKAPAFSVRVEMRVVGSRDLPVADGLTSESDFQRQSPSLQNLASRRLAERLL
jgi:hypothetical protein